MNKIFVFIDNKRPQLVVILIVQGVNYSNYMQTEIKVFINFPGCLDLEVPKRFGLLFYLANYFFIALAINSLVIVKIIIDHPDKRKTQKPIRNN